MDYKELRIGNLVDLYGSIATVGRFDFNDRPPNGLAIDKGKPIPLTEDWLSKFGFENYDDNRWFNFSFEIRQWFNPKRYIYGWSGGNIEIKYVHQLQNLIFALTGKELTIQENAKIKN